MAGMRPVLVPSLSTDPDQKVLWRDGPTMHLSGGRAIAERDEHAIIYLAIGLRNVGTGLALLHGWYPTPGWRGAEDPHAPISEFRRQIIDLYIPSNGAGYWEGALRDEHDPLHSDFLRVLVDRVPFTIDLMYGDQDGGQRTISRCLVLPASDGGWYGQVARHWNIDREDPR